MLDGHSDCVFCPLEKGLILSTEYKTTYNKTYPGWEIYWLTNNPVRERVVSTHGGFFQWHAPFSQSQSKAFADHITQYAQDWVGQADETIFDVNILKVKDDVIFTVGEDDDLFRYLESKGYKVESFDFKCKTFWDSGMHCATNDIRRSGNCPDFFPGQGGPALDWQIDGD
jgi:N-dimethylarginine dimethylaminohydrolase